MMTFNGYILLAIALGETLGYLLYQSGLDLKWFYQWFKKKKNYKN